MAKKGKLLFGFVLMLGLVMIGSLASKNEIQAKETNPLYSYCDSKTDLCGFVDANGKVVIDPVYESVGDFFEGLAMVQNEERNWGFIDKTGKVVVPLIYKMCGDFSEGLAYVETEDEKCGYVDTSGNMVISPVYIGANSFSEGLACVRTESGKYGYIDKNGKMVIKAKYGDAYSFSDGLARVRVGTKVLYIDKNGKTKIAKKQKNDNSDYLDFMENVAAFYKDGRFGFIDKKGKQLFMLDKSIEYADDFYDGRCIVYR